MIHILRHGLPLCAFTSDVPRDWPPDHTWVGVEDAKDSDCTDCRFAHMRTQVLKDFAPTFRKLAATEPRPSRGRK